MTKKVLFVGHSKIITFGVLVGLCLLIGGSARAAATNWLKNPGFEDGPIGVGSATTNWSVLYLKGGPDDFEIKDRTRSASMRSAWYGAEFRPRSQKPIHACFTQTVTGLTTNHQYNVSGSMWTQWGDPEGRNKCLVFIEAIGRSGNLMPDGRRSIILANTANAYVGDLYANGELDQNNPVFGDFAAKQTPDANGKIEVRLHFQMLDFVTYDKCWQMSTYFDDLFLTN